MGNIVGVAGGTPTWRRGIGAVLGDAGYEVSGFESLSEWAPGIGGSVVVAQVDDSQTEAVAAMVDSFPHIPLITVVAKLDVASAAQWVRTGACAVIDDADEPGVLLAALEATQHARSSVPLHILKAMAATVPRRQDLAQWISGAEAGWLRQMAAGTTVAELAEANGYSERAMFRLLKHLYTRLGVRNRTGALLWAERNGLLQGD